MNGNQQLKMVNNEQIKSAVIELLSVSTTCYDDPTKDHSEPAASTTAPNNQMNVEACHCYPLSVSYTANAAIQIDDIQVHERYATKQNDFDEKCIRIIF
ncbi:unnamed protein product, partial [Rotaria magnacalcarata]